MFVLVLVFAAVVGFFLHRTAYGRYWYAIGHNELAAKYAGVNVNRHRAAVYVVCSALAALVGVLLFLSESSVQPNNAGETWELYAILGAVLGGCSLRGGEGTAVGMVLGAMVLPVIRNIVDFRGEKSDVIPLIVGITLLLGTIIDELIRRRSRVHPVAEGARRHSPLANTVRPTVHRQTGSGDEIIVEEVQYRGGDVRWAALAIHQRAGNGPFPLLVAQLWREHHRAGQHRVHAHVRVARAEFHRKHPREAGNRGLAGEVRGVVAIRAHVGPVPDVHDRATARLLHHRQPDVLAHQKRAEQVRVEVFAHVGRSHVFEPLAVPDRRAVHQRVDVCPNRSSTSFTMRRTATSSPRSA